MTSEDIHGRYFCVGVLYAISEKGELYVTSDRVEITPRGDLIHWRSEKDGSETPVLTIATGQWLYNFAASIMDDSPVACEHWPGETNNGIARPDLFGKTERSKVRDSSAPLTKRFKIMERDNFTCRLCGRKPPEVTLEVDHVHPVSKGGKTVDSNLWTLCYDCNRGKRDRELVDPMTISGGNDE